QAHGKVVAEDPRGEHRRIELAGDGRKVHRAAAVQLPLAHEVARPQVVGLVGDHQLELVGLAQHVEVGPVVALRLARTGALDVDNLPHARVDGCNVDGAAGL